MGVPTPPSSPPPPPPPPLPSPSFGGHQQKGLLLLLLPLLPFLPSRSFYVFSGVGCSSRRRKEGLALHSDETLPLSHPLSPVCVCVCVCVWNWRRKKEEKVGYRQKIPVCPPPFSSSRLVFYLTVGCTNSKMMRISASFIPFFLLFFSLDDWQLFD